MKKLALLICMLAGGVILTSCAQPGSENKEQDATAATVDEGATQDADFVVDGEEPELNSLTNAESEADPTAVVENATGAVQPVINGDLAEYVVEKNDTLMLIAFNIYGDYSKWKEIQDLNPGIKPGALIAGTVIKYVQPKEKFVWNPQGNPYLIKKGDTLGIISNDVYQTMQRWKEIYDNNRPMIKDPNLIFAGFTLYYIPDSKVAMEKL